MNRTFLWFALIAVTSCVTAASAQEHALATPQSEHELLERLAGEWRFERHIADGSRGTGVVSAEMVGRFFVVSRWSGTVNGAAFEGFQSLGYATEQERYSGYWIDSFLSHSWELEGSFDEASQELTLTASGPAPTGGATMFRERYHFESADSITIIGEMKLGESWMTISTTHLTRTGR